MNVPSKSRKRAVRLTPEALATLQTALAERWQEDDRAGRLTREVQAELLGLGVATVKRILSGQGVDRATLAQAFRGVGLAWDESRCEPVAAKPSAICTEPEPEPEPRPESEPIREVAFAPEARPVAVSRGRRRLLEPALAGLALVMVGWAAFAARTTVPDDAWREEFDRAMADGGVAYHRADYARSRTAFHRALALARAHDSANMIAFATHTGAMLAQEAGRYREAKAGFEQEAAIRRGTGQRTEDNPVLSAALGQVETLLGEFPAAERDLVQSLEGFRKAGDGPGEASALADLGSLALARGELDRADTRFDESLARLEALSKPDNVADVRGRQAMVLLRRDRAGEARAVLQGCLDHWTAKGQARWIALCELQLGQAEEALGWRDLAAVRIARSKAAFERCGDRARVAEASACLRRLGAPGA